MGRPKKSQREKDLTSRYMSGGYDEDRADSEERFSPQNKARQKERILKTAIMRAEEAPARISTHFPSARSCRSIACIAMWNMKARPISPLFGEH